MRKDLYEYRTETDSNYANRFTALSIHFERLDNYHPTWSLIDKVVFEALLVNSRKFGNKAFFFQQRRWENQIGDTWYNIKQSLFRFQDMGFVNIERREPKKMYYYTLNYGVITDNLYKIYDFSGDFGSDLTAMKERLKIFFEWWRDSDFNNGKKLVLEDDELSIKYAREQFIEESLENVEHVAASEDDINIDHGTNPD